MRFIFFLFIGFYVSHLNAQDEPCPYIPISYDEYMPMWRHLVIDSSIIGYEDTSALYFTTYYDGMQHLSFDAKSFVHEEYLYSLTMVKSDLDISGYIMEKINLSTGELMWKVVADRRTEEYDYKIKEAYVEADTIWILGGHTLTQDHFVFNFSTGTERMVLFRRAYDVNTGALLVDESPDVTDSEATHFTSYSTDTFYYFDEYVDYVKIGRGDAGVSVTKTTLDRLGRNALPTDTIFKSQFVDIWDESQTDVYNILERRKSDNHILVLDQFFPNPGSSHPSQLILHEFDENYQEIRQIDLNNIGLNDLKDFLILRYTDDRIVLRACRDLFTVNCHLSYIILDTDFNFIKRIDAIADNMSIDYTTYQTEMFDENDNLILNTRTLNDDDINYVQFYTSNTEGTLDSIFRLTVQEDNWVSPIVKTFILNNGDYLFKTTHSCYYNDDKDSWHPEWLRFDADMLSFPVNVYDYNTQSNINFYPNPAYDELYFDQAISRVDVYQMSGKFIFTKDCKGQKSLRLDNLDAGMYIFRVIDGSDAISIHKHMVY